MLADDLRSRVPHQRTDRSAAQRAVRRRRGDVRSNAATSCSARASRPTSCGSCSRVRSNWCVAASTRRFVLATMSTPGQWAGGLRAWGDASSSAGYRATGIAVTDGRMFNVPSDDLGRLVGEWFPFGKHMVIGVYQTVRGIEAAARQRESLVALGTLAAGLAHEINNPAAASLRAVEGLRAEPATRCSPRSSASPSRRSPPTSTSRSIGCAGSWPNEPSSDDGAVATMDREEAIGSWLEDHGVDDAWQIAPLFASAGADEAWFEECESVVGSDALGAGAALDLVDDQRVAAAVGVDRHDQPDHATSSRR